MAISLDQARQRRARRTASAPIRRDRAAGRTTNLSGSATPPDWLESGLHAGASERVALAVACWAAPGAFPAIERLLRQHYSAGRTEGQPLAYWRETIAGRVLLRGRRDADVLRDLEQQLGRPTPIASDGLERCTFEELLLVLGPPPGVVLDSLLAAGIY